MGCGASVVDASGTPLPSRVPSMSRGGKLIRIPTAPGVDPAGDAANDNAEEPPLTHTHKQEAPGAEEEAAAALEELMKLPENNLKRAYLDVTRDGMPLGRIVLELRSDVLPRTVENFLRLVTGDMSRDTPEELCYRTTVFHTVLPGQMVVGGDILGNDGTGQPVSIYGGTFEDEGFPVKHDSAGIISMVNTGPNSNAAQFFITLAPAPRLDGQHVAFGCVQSGLEVLKAMERNGSTNGTPTAILEIQACGELPPIPTLRARSPLSPKGAHTPVGLRTPVGSHTQGMLGTPKASKLSSLKKHNSSKNFT